MTTPRKPPAPSEGEASFAATGVSASPSVQSILAALTAEIVRRVPEIMQKCGCGKCDYCYLFPEGEPRDITIEDVLRAWKEKFPEWCCSKRKKDVWESKIIVWEDMAKIILGEWQLGVPLHLQKPEVHSFLFPILCQK